MAIKHSCTYNGVPHSYAATNENLPEILREVCDALNLEVPAHNVRDEAFVRREAIAKIKRLRGESVMNSWLDNPDRMGR
jgi:hypothetical protein